MYDISKVNVCGCLGSMYGEPHCPCTMKRLGLQSVMDSNPIRKEAMERDRVNWEKENAPGGFFYEMFRKNREANDEHQS
jgi:hypothetical protein